MWHPSRVAPRALLAAVLVAASTRAQTTPTLYPEVIASHPHDPEAFTQGLVWHDGSLYESTGLVGRSTLRRVNLLTGEVELSVALPSSEFGEGLALVDERLIQLTWQDGVAHVYERSSLAELTQFRYDGEGWGLCYDGSRLVMSDGSSSLFFRDPDSFELWGQVEVLLDGTPIDQLNELECTGGLVHANVWQTDWILRIDPGTGNVLAQVDASGLLEPAERASADVLNGIAYAAERGHFFLTGKLWPKLFEVRLPEHPSSPTPDAGELIGSAVPAPTAAHGSSEDAPPTATLEPDVHRPTPRGGCRTQGTGTAASWAWFGLLAVLRLLPSRRTARDRSEAAYRCSAKPRAHRT